MAPRVVLRPTAGAARTLATVPVAAAAVPQSWRASEGSPVNPVSPGHGGSVTVQRAVDTPLESTDRPAHPASLNGSTAAAGGGIGSVPAQAGGAGVDVDRLIEAIEERVLAEIERRGGRYRGMF